MKVKSQNFEEKLQYLTMKIKFLYLVNPSKVFITRSFIWISIPLYFVKITNTAMKKNKY